MSNEVFTAYWIGQEPTGPGKSPTLDQTPSYVDVVPLAFVTLDDKYQLDFSFLCSQNSETTIKGWIKNLKTQGPTKVLFSINDQKIASVPDAKSFATLVKGYMKDWDVDGVDIDFEPPFKSDNLLTVVSQLRTTLGDDALLTAPIYSAWLWNVKPDFLNKFAKPLDYLTTMDYTPYPGYQGTLNNVKQYAEIIGSKTDPAYEKVGIGISCMGPPQPKSNNFTPLDDVKKLCKWEPGNGKTKQGAMLYTTSYDIKTRPGSGTGYPDGTWTETIHENLP